MLDHPCFIPSPCSGYGKSNRVQRARSPIIFRSKNRSNKVARIEENTRSIESRARIISSRRSVSFSNTCPLRRHIPWTNTAVSLDAFAIRIEPAGTIFNETSVTFAYRDIQFCEAAKNKGSRKEEGAEVAVTR